MIRRAVSTSYSSTTSGGASRSELFPQPRSRRPFLKARPTISWGMSGAANAALYFVADEQDAVAIADRARVLQVARRRDDVSALSLDRLDENCGDAVGRHLLGEQLLFDPRRAPRRAGRLAAAVLAA